MDPQQWLREYQAKGEAMVRRSQQFQQQLQAVSETATSRDGAVTVTVNPSGALLNLSLTPRIRELPEAELAQLILQTAREAQNRVVHQVAQLIEPVSGQSGALAFLRGQLPPLDGEQRDEQHDERPHGRHERDDRDDYGRSFLR